LAANRSAAILFAAILVLFSLAAESSAQGVFGFPDNKQIDSDLRAATNFIRVGDYARAVEFLDQMKATYGEDQRITELYKQAYKMAKMYPQLEELIRGELAKEPKKPILLIELGEVRFLQNDETTADSLWKRGLEIGRSDEMTYRYVADVQMRFGLYGSAVDVYLIGRRNLNKPALFSMELANIYEAQHDYPKAIDEYIALLYSAPDQIGMISTRIRGLAEDSEDSREIVNTIKARLKEAPGRTELNEILGDLYIKLGEMDKAIECYKTVGTSLNDDGQSLIRFATRAYESKAYGVAIGAIDEYFKISKEQRFGDMAILVKAKAQLADGQFNEALANYRTLAANSMDYRIKDEAGLTSGRIFAQELGNCDSAMSAWSAMLLEAVDPVMGNGARLGMALCHIMSDEYANADALLAQIAAAGNADPNFERALFLMGEIRLYSADFKKADEIFRQMVRQFPNADYSNDALMRIDIISLAGDDSTNVSFLVPFARAMKANLAGRHIEAAEILSDSSFAKTPISEQAIFYAGVAFASGNDIARAVNAFRGYIDKFPDGLYTDRAYLEIGDIFGLRPETYPDARAAYNKVLELYPDGPVTEIARQRLRLLAAPGKVG